MYVTALSPGKILLTQRLGLCSTSASAMCPLTVLGLLLSCAVSLREATVVMDNDMPIGWAQTMGSVSDLPTQGGIATPNPFDYYHRYSFSRLIIDATNPFMISMGPSPADNPMWSLAMQLVWIHASGRFADPTGATLCGKAPGDTNCISPESWWGCVNYFVSAMPFLSAAQQGFMGEGYQVTFQKPDDATDYCTTHAECSNLYPDAMAKWDAFFQGLISVGASALSDNEKKDAILGLLWSAQMASIQSSSICNGRKAHYSSKEVAFAESWLYIFDYLSAVYFQSNLMETAKFVSPLPPRILEEGDEPRSIPDMSLEENHSLYIFSWLRSINNLMGGSLASAWKQSMCSAELREKGRHMMSQLILDPYFPTSSFVSVITGSALNC